MTMMALTNDADPRAATEAYLRQHRLQELASVLLARLVFERRDDPRAALASMLERAKVAGVAPLLTRGDLGVVFDMLDVTRRGGCTGAQARAVLHTLVGGDAGGGGEGGSGSAAGATGAAAAAAGDKQSAPPPPWQQQQQLLDREGFVAAVAQELAQSTPLCKPDAFEDDE